MSETLNRRTFLAGTLSVLALGCAQQERATPTATPPRDTLTAPLRDFILARYDIALKRRTSIPQETRAALEAALTENNLGDEITAHIETAQEIPTLTAHFERTGLRFRMLEYRRTKGYELFRAAPREKRTLTLFDRKVPITLDRITHVLIPHALAYAVEGGVPGSMRIGHYVFSTKIIELYEHLQPVLAGKYYDGCREKGPAIAQQMSAPDSLDQYIQRSAFARPNAPVQASTDFWENLRLQLRYTGLRELFEGSKDRESFVRQCSRDLEEDILYHEAMHAADYAEADLRFPEQTPAIAKELFALTEMHGEIRAYLSSIIHGHARRMLTEVVNALSSHYPRNDDPHRTGAQLLLQRMAEHIAANPQNFPVKPPFRDALDVLKQLPALSEEQVRGAARAVYMRMYQENSLMQYIQTFVPDKK